MQITLTPANPAETRLIAAFLQDLADLQETPESNVAQVLQATVGSPSSAGDAAPRKPRTRKEKTDSNPPASAQAENANTGAPTATDSGAHQDDASAPETSSAASAEEAGASSSNETASAAEADEKIDHDSLRVLMGRCAQANKRAESVQIVKGYGYSGISAIKPEHFAEINAKLKGLLDA